MPATLAGTIQRWAVHQLVHSGILSLWSGCQPSIVNEFDTTRVPGVMARIAGRSFMLIWGSRNMVITCAFEKSVSNRIGLREHRSVGDALGRGVAPGQLDHVGVVFDALGPKAALGGRDDRAAVAGSEINQKVLGRHLRQVEHRVDKRLRSGHPDHVLAGLSDLRFKRRWRLRPLGERTGRENRQDHREDDKPNRAK